MVLIARVLLFLQLVVLAAAVGAVVTFFGLYIIARLLGADDMNGGLAMGAAGLAPYGAVAGALLGGWLIWRLLARMGRNATLLGGYGLITLVICAIAGYFLIEDLTDGNPYTLEEEPVLLVEWRLPEKIPHHMADRIFRYSLRSTYMDWSLTLRWNETRIRDEGDVSILQLRGKLRWRKNGRKMQLWRAPNHDDRITVDLGLDNDPAHQEGFGPWKEVAEHPGYAFRTRVVRQ